MTFTYKRFKYITVAYDKYVKPMTDLIAEHYDTKQYSGVLFLVNAVTINNVWLKRSDFNYDRIIFYNLEHYEVSYIEFPDFFNAWIGWLRDMKFEEIWDFNIENIGLLPEDLKRKTRFMPLRYTDRLYDNPYDIPKTFDIGFTGVLELRHVHRLNVLSDIQYIYEADENYHEVRFKLMKGFQVENLKYDLSNCKYVIDIINNRASSQVLCTQNQVRIFELIMRGYKVIAEDVNGVNYFPEIIDTFGYPADDVREENTMYGLELLRLLDRPYVDDHEDKRQLYKQMTYRDEDFELYKQQRINDYNNILKQ